MKKIIAFVLIFTLMLGLPACSILKRDKSLPLITACLSEEPHTLDPTLASGNPATDTYLSHLFEGLTTVDKELNITVGTAESWTVSADGLVYKFYLNPEAKWNDEQPVTAGAFEYALQRLADPKADAEMAHHAFYIKNGENVHSGQVPPSALGVRALNDYALEITLEHPCSYFLELLATPAFFPVRQDIVSANPGGWAFHASTFISNGPFKVEDWVRGESLSLVKNPHYWNAKGISGIDLKFLFMSDSDSIYKAFKSDDILLAQNIPSFSFKKEKSNNTLTFSDMFATDVLIFNNLKAPFDDPLIRKALSLAVDRNFLIDSIWQDERKPAGALVPPGIMGPDGMDFRIATDEYFDTSSEKYADNLEIANNLLNQAGYVDVAGFPDLRILITGEGNNPYLAQAIQQQWLDGLGIGVSITTLSRKDFELQITGNNWNVALDTVSVRVPTPFEFLARWSTGSGQDYAKYMTASFDKSIDDSAASPNASSKSALLHNAETALIGRDMALLPLSYKVDSYLTSPKLKGVLSSSTGVKYFYWCEKTKK